MIVTTRNNKPSNLSRATLILSEIALEDLIASHRRNAVVAEKPAIWVKLISEAESALVEVRAAR